MFKELKLGIYEHYKGKKYLAIGIAHHSETQELMAVYIPLYEHTGAGMAVRPLSMFLEDVEVEGEVKSRFKYLGPVS
jgi:hypothetical protein